MPTYEFRCPDGTIIERVFKMSEVPDSIPSPKGDGMAVRVISGGADLIFKGSGFYITDYGKDGKKDLREKASKSDGDKGAKSDSSKTETAAKSESKSESSAPAKSETKSKPSSGNSE